MNALSIRTAPDWVAKSFAILSVAFFWLLPYSPLLAIGALLATQGSLGWARRVAIAGAVLCSVLTIVAAIVIAVGAVRFGIGG